MPTATRTPRRSPVQSRRSPTAGRYARASAHRGQGLRRRKPPEPTGLKKVLSAMLPATAAKKATPSSKKGKAGGLALVAAAAGMAFKNRDKLGNMRHKNEAGTTGTTTTSQNDVVPPPPTTPSV